MLCLSPHSSTDATPGVPSSPAFLQEKSPSVLFIAVRLFIEWLQLFLLLVNFNYGFNGLVSSDNKAWWVPASCSLPPTCNAFNCPLS